MNNTTVKASACNEQRIKTPTLRRRDYTAQNKEKGEIQ